MKENTLNKEAKAIMLAAFARHKALVEQFPEMVVEARRLDISKMDISRASGVTRPRIDRILKQHQEGS